MQDSSRALPAWLAGSYDVTPLRVMTQRTLVLTVELSHQIGTFGLSAGGQSGEHVSAYCRVWVAVEL